LSQGRGRTEKDLLCFAAPKKRVDSIASRGRSRRGGGGEQNSTFLKKKNPVYFSFGGVSYHRKKERRRYGREEPEASGRLSALNLVGNLKLFLVQKAPKKKRGTGEADRMLPRIPIPEKSPPRGGKGEIVRRQKEHSEIREILLSSQPLSLWERAPPNKRGERGHRAQADGRRGGLYLLLRSRLLACYAGKEKKG